MANCSPNVSAASQGRKGARLAGGISSSAAVFSSSALVLVDKMLRRVCPGGKKPYFAISTCETGGACAPAKSGSKNKNAGPPNAPPTGGGRHFTPGGGCPFPVGGEQMERAEQKNAPFRTRDPPERRRIDLRRCIPRRNQRKCKAQRGKARPDRGGRAAQPLRKFHE